MKKYTIKYKNFIKNYKMNYIIKNRLLYFNICIFIIFLQNMNQNIDLGEYYYKPEDSLGKGNFGQVFKGYRKSDNLPVAIKIMHK